MVYFDADDNVIIWYVLYDEAWEIAIFNVFYTR